MSGTFIVGKRERRRLRRTAGPGAITARTKLALTSGPGFTITLRTAAGKAVTLDAKAARTRSSSATAQRDPQRAPRAPGYNRATTVPLRGTQTWKVKLAQAGTLRFLCDPHAAQS